MTDTSPETEARFKQLFSQCSPGDRVRMACEMFDLARGLMTARIRAEDPSISNPDLRVRLFERTYADDFDESEQFRIIKRLRGSRQARVRTDSPSLSALGKRPTPRSVVLVILRIDLPHRLLARALLVRVRDEPRQA